MLKKHFSFVFLIASAIVIFTVSGVVSAQEPAPQYKMYTIDGKQVRLRIIPSGSQSDLVQPDQQQSAPVTQVNAPVQPVRPNLNATKLFVEISGFESNFDAEKFVGEWLKLAHPGRYKIVPDRDLADETLEVRAVASQVKSWQGYSLKQSLKNEAYRFGANTATRILYHGSKGSYVRGQAASVISNQAYQRQQNPYLSYNKWDVRVEMLHFQKGSWKPDDKFGGKDTFVLSAQYPNYGQPEIHLVDGDMSTVIDDPTKNLDGRSYMLMQLAAFMKVANDPENEILKQGRE